MRKYKTLNNIFGWLAFVIAAFTYLSTIESTASLWDCGEFIASGDKLEVGHPPGAPLFLMLVRFFTMFAPTLQSAAIMANVLSALMSAFTILFLFWSISHLARKFISKKTDDFQLSDYLIVLGSSMVGALIYTFSDTFWFSAVEGEVYATSSLITAVVFWAILKWEECADEKYANRWLVLIAYITGLSIGVHLLNLLAIPAIVFVYYFRKYPVSKWGIVKTSLVSLLLLAFAMWVLIPGIPKMASWFELPFVNSFGLPVNSGVIFYIALLTAGLVYALRYTYRKGKVLANTVWLCLAMCMVGYGSYAMIVIRSSANPPMDQNNPDNIFALISYLNRDQYGDRPLLTGQYYNAPSIGGEDKFSYVLVNGRYEKAGFKQTTEYDTRYTTFLPRMYSDDKEKIAVYKQYVKRGKMIPGGEGEQAIVPRFSENMTFMFDYQLGYMYWRYFMWNFAGRQNDLKATKGDPTRGNWISGIKFIDEARLGTQDNQPAYMTQNKGHNVYYMLPLLLGLLGLVYQFMRDKRNFAVTAMLFFFTGIAIVLYLNQTPNEVRERDYAYAGSFYAFAIWAGLGVVAIYKLLNRIAPKTAAAGIATVASCVVPVIMAQQNWDDHNRHGRYVAADFGYNYLNSCDEKGIVFVYGDNDTFPLWYNQEVEEVRTDMRVANAMYLGADWYYEQLMRTTYTSTRFNLTATQEKIAGERRAIIPVFEKTTGAINAKTAMAFIMSDNDKHKETINGQIMGSNRVNYLQSRKLAIPINKNEVIAQGFVPATDTAFVSSMLVMTQPKVLQKNNLAVLDIVTNNFLQRPIYFGVSLPDEYKMELMSNMVLEGMAYKLVPYNASKNPVNIDKTYDLLVNKFRYRGLNNPNVYLDLTARNQVSFYRKIFFDLGEELAGAGKTDSLKTMLVKYDEVIPLADSPLYQNNPLVRLYLIAGEKEKAIKLTTKLCAEYEKEIAYFVALYRNKFDMTPEIRTSFIGLNNLSSILSMYQEPELLKIVEESRGRVETLLQSTNALNNNM